MGQEQNLAADVIAVQTTLLKSLRAADEKNWKLQATLYADEVKIDFGGVQPSQTITPPELARWSALSYALVTTMHMQTNVDVTIDGDKATSHSYGHARHVRTDTHDYWHIYARYENDFLRTGDGWKIS